MYQMVNKVLGMSSEKLGFVPILNYSLIAFTLTYQSAEQE